MLESWLLQRSCKRKQYYRSRREAKDALKKCARKWRDKGLSVYPCQFCPGFHIGHSRQ